MQNVSGIEQSEHERVIFDHGVDDAVIEGDGRIEAIHVILEIHDVFAAKTPEYGFFCGVVFVERACGDVGFGCNVYKRCLLISNFAKKPYRNIVYMLLDDLSIVFSARCHDAISFSVSVSSLLRCR